MPTLELIKQIWDFIGPLVGAAGGFLLGTKRRKIDTQIAQGDALDKMQLAYDKFVTDATKQYEVLNTQVAVLKDREREHLQKHATLEERLANVVRQRESDTQTILHLNLQVEQYKADIDRYTKRVSELEAELEKYKPKKGATKHITT